METTISDIRKEYPLVGYRFNVHFKGQDIPFTEVSGLEIERQAITYRDGLGVKYMPGMDQPIKLTLKKGVVKGDNNFFSWINSITLNAVDKHHIIISLLDDENKPVVSWNIQNAFPTKLSAPTLDAKSNEVAIESLELMADALRIETK